MGFCDDNPNFSIVNGKAYTEDNVLVYNIFVCHIPQKTTKTQTAEYFKKFGKIENVRLMNDRKRKNSHQANKIGFVNFCDPLVAAKVLKNSNHYIHNKRIRVRACDSWHQPGAQTTAEETAGEDSLAAECPPQDALILNLNDDCLETILKQLPMIDQISFARSCRRLREVFIMRSKLEYKMLDICTLKSLTLWQARQFLEMAGPQIESLDGDLPHGNRNRVIEFLGSFCTNVKSLSLQNNEIRPSALRKLLRNMTAITRLELNDVLLCDACIPVIIKKLPNLKDLSLKENCEITGKHIKELTQLERLSLSGCLGITSRNFANICESLTELKTLDIRNCPMKKAAHITENLTHLKKLETLIICSESRQIHRLAELPKLKHLLLFADDPFQKLSLSLLEQLAKRQSNQLETLCLDSYNCLDLSRVTQIAELKKLKKLKCPNNEGLTDDCLKKLAMLPDLEMINLKGCTGFTDVGLLDLIESCPKLQLMDLAHCTQIKDSFPRMVVELLKAQRTQRDQSKPLIISVFNSGINQFGVATQHMESATDLVEFKFGFQFDDNDVVNDDYFTSDEDSDYDEDLFFGGMGEDDDDDYYMYYSDPEEVDGELGFDILRHVLFAPHHPYADELNDIELF